MKISEMVTHLEEIKSRKGDIDVVLWIDNVHSPIIGSVEATDNKVVLLDEHRFLIEMNKIEEQ